MKQFILVQKLAVGIGLAILFFASVKPMFAAEPSVADSTPTPPPTPTNVWVALGQGEYYWYAYRDEEGFCSAASNQPPQPQPPPTAGKTERNAPANSSAEHPLPPVGQTWVIDGSDTHWYAFRDEGDASSIQVRADASADQCITFQVWTPEELRLWQLGETFRPIGQGTANVALKADLFWTGSFVKSGTYYVIVKRSPTASGLCTYQLWVTGDDVSLVIPSANR